MKSQRVVQVIVVGAGFGGLRAARSLAHAPVKVTVIDKSNYHLFQPLLYQVATASLSPADIASPIRSILREQRNAEVLMEEVIGVDKEKLEVITKSGRLPFDFLVLATGARHGYFGHEQWEESAPGIKTISDATHIRQRILMAFEAAEMEADAVKRKHLLTFILIGGGPTGVELAGAIAELSHRALALDFRRIDPKSARIILLEAGSTILSSFPIKLASKAQRALERLGVEVRLQSRVESVSEEGALVSGKMIYSRNIIWAAGVAASPVGKWLDADTDRAGRVKVLPDLSVPNYPEIFVIGDAAHVIGEIGNPLPGVAPVALQEGRHVACVIEARIQGNTSAFRFRYTDKGNLATVGRGYAIVSRGNFSASGFAAWLLWLSVHIYYLIGFRNRFLVLIQWAWAYLTFQRGARLITDLKMKEDTPQ